MVKMVQNKHYYLSCLNGVHSSVMREENPQEKASRQYRTSSKNKESYKWITSLKETLRSIPEETQVITLGNRESDIFEFLWDAQALGTLFVIRNRQNRRFICPEIGKTKVQTSLNKLSTKARDHL